jgi:hypothetical protein
LRAPVQLCVIETFMRGKKLVIGGEVGGGRTDYVVAATSSDGTALPADVPTTGKAARDLAVDMTALSRPSHGSWFDFQKVHQRAQWILSECRGANIRDAQDELAV